MTDDASAGASALSESDGAFLCGWSMGGLVAMMIAARHRPAGLVLIEPSLPAEVAGVRPAGCAGRVVVVVVGRSVVVVGRVVVVGGGNVVVGSGTVVLAGDLAPQRQSPEPPPRSHWRAHTFTPRPTSAQRRARPAGDAQRLTGGVRTVLLCLGRGGVGSSNPRGCTTLTRGHAAGSGRSAQRSGARCRRWTAGRRQLEDGVGASAVCSPEPRRPAVRLSEVGHDGEPQSGATERSHGRTRCSPEAIEGPRPLLRV